MVSVHVSVWNRKVPHHEWLRSVDEDFKVDYSNTKYAPKWPHVVQLMPWSDHRSRHKNHCSSIIAIWKVPHPNLHTQLLRYSYGSRDFGESLSQGLSGPNWHLILAKAFFFLILDREIKVQTWFQKSPISWNYVFFGSLAWSRNYNSPKYLSK